MKWLIISNAAALAMSAMSLVISMSTAPPGGAVPTEQASATAASRGAVPRGELKVKGGSQPRRGDIDSIVEAKVKKALKAAIAEAKAQAQEDTAHPSAQVALGTQNGQMDLGGATDPAEKAKLILKSFEGVNSYSHDNALVKQLAEMGREVIEPLLAELPRSNDHSGWAKRMAIDEALSKLLTEDDRDLIIDLFEKDKLCAKLIKEHAFPEAEDALLRMIDGNVSGLDPSVIDAALSVCPAKATEALTHYAERANPDTALSAFRALAELNDTDISALLAKQAVAAQSPWARSEYTVLLLERGQPEAFDLMLGLTQSLSDGKLGDYHQQRILAALRKHTHAKVYNIRDAEEWLKANADNLCWSSERRRFE